VLRTELVLELEEAVRVAAGTLLAGDGLLNPRYFYIQAVNVEPQLGHAHRIQYRQRVKTPLVNEDLLFWPGFFVV
jgi:hypothetical protein